MVEQNKKFSIIEKIDKDEGLRSKRKISVIISLVLLALSVSGAKVEEVNTFIFKINFENYFGIGILLVFSVLFLMIRYFNYARSYHSELFRLWSDRMLKNPYFFEQCYHSDEIKGLVVEKFPNESNFSELPHAGGQLEERNHSWSYKCSAPFIRKFSYSWSDDYDFYERDVFIGWENYLKVFSFEIKYQLESFLTHRENLDIYTPYILGFLAISSYFFKEQFNAFIKLLAGI